MDWKRAAIDDLQRHALRKKALVNLKERMEVLQAKFEGVSGPRLDGIPAKGGACRREMRMVENIAERTRLQEARQHTQRLVQLVEQGLGALDAEQRRVLEGFYLNTGKGRAEQLCAELGVERATVYRLRDEALRSYTLAMYGLVDE